MGYRHIDIACAQSAKYAGSACGDVVKVHRTATATLLACADGLGSGIKANLAATMCISRLIKLMDGGFSLREAFATLVRTMNDAREPGLPFAAFSVVRFLSNGETTVLSYEMPPPVLVAYNTVAPLRQRPVERNGALIGEASCYLDEGEALMLVSDGITQAGLGNGMGEGWGMEGLCRYVRSRLSSKQPMGELADLVHNEARRYWGEHGGDDCTATAAVCRKGRVVTLFTGPPISKKKDYAVATRFLQNDGVKVLCGATTAKLVAQHLGKSLEVSDDSLQSIAPPHYRLDGIDLVTEGAVTLNQVYNILEENPENYEPNSGVSKLCGLLRDADRINFIVGRSPNLAEGDIAFRQQGILPRTTIVPLIAQKLEETGKLVVVEYV